MSEQLRLAVLPSCKERGCTAPVVGHSITGHGHVCSDHNRIEWGRALAGYDDDLSRKLLA